MMMVMMTMMVYDDDVHIRIDEGDVHVIDVRIDGLMIRYADETMGNQ